MRNNTFAQVNGAKSSHKTGRKSSQRIKASRDGIIISPVFPYKKKKMMRNNSDSASRRTAPSVSSSPCKKLKISSKGRSSRSILRKKKRQQKPKITITKISTTTQLETRILVALTTGTSQINLPSPPREPVAVEASKFTGIDEKLFDADFWCGNLAADLVIPQITQESRFPGLLLQDAQPSADVVDYSSGVIQKMLNKETQMKVNPTFLDWQAHVTENLRAQIVDSFIYCAFHLGLKDEAIHLAVQIIDRVMTAFRIQQHRLRSLVFAAIHIAAKCVESRSPHVADYIRVLRTDLAREQVLRMEAVILNALTFDFGFPTSFLFAKAWIYHSGFEHDAVFVHMVRYLLELSLLQMAMLSFSPSKIAASAIMLACECFGIKDRPLTWEYSMSDLSDCMQRLRTAASRAHSDPQFRIVHSKYKQQIHDQVSLTASGIFHLTP
eukprot:c20930_g1_i1.p1 GENE.c20930_g1_i1~~c20930_g1_i1.p1  ORF type:complete len:439 (+),score=78.79 c20930_g1_i1:178-1494(+)